MNYAIIGFGKIGHALAKAFARNGIEVRCNHARPRKLCNRCGRDWTGGWLVHARGKNWGHLIFNDLIKFD